MPVMTLSTEPIWFLDTLVVIRLAHAESEDGLSLIDNLARRGDSPPLHLHHREDEAFHVLDGELRLQVGERELRLGAGESALAPRGVPHTYRVETGTARWLVVTSGGDFEGLVRALSRPATAEELPPRSGPPTPEQQERLAAACLEHGIELVGPPLR